LFLLILFLFLLLTPAIFSLYWAHALVAVFCLFNIKTFARYYLFWFLFIVVLLFSSQARLSLEHFLIISSIFAFTRNINLEAKQKKITLAIIFFVFFAMDFFNINLAEQGSVFMFLPVFLALEFPLQRFNLQSKSYKKFFVYLISFFGALFSNKRTTLLAFLASLQNLFSRKLLIIFSFLILVVSFVVSDNVKSFYKKSIAPRVLIWQASIEGALHKPLYGHGLGTFTIDFPPYRKLNHKTHGAKSAQHIVHGHNQFVHCFFELGLLGLFLCLYLLKMIYKFSPNVFWTFLVICSFDTSLASYSQILFFALLFSDLKYDAWIFKEIHSAKIKKILTVSLILLSTYLFASSCLGHYFFDQTQFSKAIKVDPLHPLYHFSRGAKHINKNISESNQDLKKAVELAPSIGYFHAFYAATLLGTEQIEQAKYHIATAIEQLGDDAYLYVLSSVINQDDLQKSTEHLQMAIDLKPEIQEMLFDPSVSADEYLGVSANNPRLMSFYRYGKKTFLPLPVIELE
jgi:hypothetical protein